MDTLTTFTAFHSECIDRHRVWTIFESLWNSYPIPAKTTEIPGVSS